MRFHNFTYLMKEGARNIVHNRLMSFACIGVLVACLLLIGGAALVSLNVNSMVSYVESQNEVVVFLSDSMNDTDIGALDLKLKNMDNIAEVRYVSKEQGLELERQRAGEYASLFDGLEDTNPLPNKYILRVADLSALDETVVYIRGLSGVEQVNAPADVAAILVGLRQIITVAGAAVVLILVVVSIVIITNTIKLTVFNRRREINIMKYVGATDSFIRMPFLAEGMIIGLSAAIIAFLILGFGYTYLMQWIGENFADYIGTVYTRIVDFWDIAPQVFGGFALLGILVGTMGSGLFIRKYLRV